jgi:SNF2 family DNA or RNA helicase
MSMINFVTNTSDIPDSVLTIPNIYNYITTKFFRRNTKKSVINEYKLLPLKENVIWLNFSSIERNIYNAYLIDKNVSKYDVCLRQLCCHPQLIDALKKLNGTFKTLDDVEKQMVSVYKHRYVNAQKRVDKLKYLIANTNRKIIIVRLRHLGSNFRKDFCVKYVFPPEIEKPAFLKSKKVIVDENEDDEENENDNENVDDINIDENATEIENDKPELIISTENYNELKRQIRNYDENTQTVKNLQTILATHNENLKKEQKTCDGKKSTYEYYENIISKVKSAIDTFKSDEKCVICMGEITGLNIGLTKCGHLYCHSCICEYLKVSHKCPLCSTALTNEDIYKVQEKAFGQIDTTKTFFKEKKELINNLGTKLAHMILYLRHCDKHAIIFSQWDELLHRVGGILDQNGIKNVFCRGNVWQRSKTISKFNEEDDIKVIMLSSESCASGTNLTKAEVVIMLDPVYGTYEYRHNMEIQAIGRAYRMGQSKQVEVVRFIMRDSVEEDIYKQNTEEDEKNNALIKRFEIDENMIQ